MQAADHVPLAASQNSAEMVMHLIAGKGRLCRPIAFADGRHPAFQRLGPDFLVLVPGRQAPLLAVPDFINVAEQGGASRMDCQPIPQHFFQKRR